MKYIISKEASQDIENIWLYTLVHPAESNSRVNLVLFP